MERYEKYGSGEEISAHLKNVSGTFDTLNVDMIFNFPHQAFIGIDDAAVIFSVIFMQ